MDLVTHALAGAAIGSLTGDPLSFTNPFHVGAVLGSIAPDIDTLWGYRSYKKNTGPQWVRHRGITHSVPGALALSGIIAFVLQGLCPQVSHTSILMWTFLGALSHTLLDLLNCYGVCLFWPLSKKRLAMHSAPLIDPVLITVLISMPFSTRFSPAAPTALLLVLISYFWLRRLLLVRIADTVSQKFGVPGSEVNLSPPRLSFFRWHYRVYKKDRVLSGQVLAFPSVTFRELQEDAGGALFSRVIAFLMRS